MVRIDVGRDFSPTPGPRLRTSGPWSGEEFRERFLEPPLRRGDVVEVDLDGVVGYTMSFLEEAFGGLVRVFGPEIRDRVTIVSPARPHRAERAYSFMYHSTENT